MSVRYMAAIWDMALPQAEAWVLMAYADHADHQGRNIKAGVPLIAYKTGLSERQVQRITHDLVARGILVEQAPGGGRGRVVCYRIDLAAAPLKGDTMSPFSPDERVTSEAERVTPETERVTERVTSEVLKGDIAMSPEPVNRINPVNPELTTTALSARAREPEPAAAAADPLPVEKRVALAFLLAAVPDFTAPEAFVRANDARRVADWATWCAYGMTERKRQAIGSISGLIVASLKRGESPDLHGDAARRFADHVAFARSGAWPADSPWQPEAEEPEPEPEEPGSEGAEKPARDRTWEVARSQLRLQMTKSTYEAWISDTDAVRNGDTLTVFVASQQALEWIVFRLRTMITKTVKSIDQTVAELEFQVRGAA